MEALCRFLADRERGEEAVSCYAVFISRLYEEAGGDLGAYILDRTLRDENPYIRAVGRGETPPSCMVRCAAEELRTLEMAAELTPEDLLEGLPGRAFLPGFTASPVALADGYRRRAEQNGRYGWGEYAGHAKFSREQSRITPVRHPDGVRLEDLVGFRREKELLLENTRALLAGRPAANVLLTGDAGTGKSSTVKAVVNKLWTEGLRIVELRREQLRSLPAVLDELSDNPLKFILFIDDLTFRQGDEGYGALKAALEGSVSARSRNVAIYATSNRRHIVRETFSEREGDDVHRGETMQELVSLSERFGLHITFQRPDRGTYLEIVRRLASDRGIECLELEALAEQFALTRGARSPRAARQFVDSLACKKER